MADDNGLENEFEELSAEIEFYNASNEGDMSAASFYEIFHAEAVENGDFPDLDYLPAARTNGRDSYRIDGLYIDTDKLEAYIAVCDYRQTNALETIDAKGLEQSFKLAERFFRMSLQPEFLNNLEQMSPAFQAAILIHENERKIKRVRITILSNARLSTRRKTVDAKEIDGRTFTYSVLDLSRYVDIKSSKGSIEPLEIDLKELNGDMAIPCLQASGGSREYHSYLVALPGTLLSEIYGRYGARLLEQNVRSFLQARTKVNRGIIDTIGKEPDMFFAYNNGLTVTASDLQTERMEDGQLGISHISNMQIVNGGQTTASIMYAHNLRNAELENVFVQMKLSVVNPDSVEAVVPRISRYANTQNRINEADFFSSHPYHIELEQMSRRILAPPRQDTLKNSKWFYERARGQYADQRAYGSRADRNKFDIEYPKSQLINKTDLAKYLKSLERQPHVVSLGAQKCFMNFAETVTKEWNAASEPKAIFNDQYFRDVVAAAIIFKWCDKMVAASEWYKIDRAYKANTVTYTIAWLAEHVQGMGKSIDFHTIWIKQEPPEALQDAMEQIAPIIAKAIRNAPGSNANIGQYTKQQACWEAVKKITITLRGNIDHCLISKEEQAQKKKDAREEGEIDGEIQLEMLAAQYYGKAEVIRSFANQKGFNSPKANVALDKIDRSKPFNKSDLNAWSNLVQNLRAHDFEFPDMN